MRLHKARQNEPGTFSIGKSWVLDDLTAIESYTNPSPPTAEEQQNKERARGLGFLITIQKPYYWEAISTKEKDFFIYSIIRIYKKYTGGKLPQLHGFNPQELEQLVGLGPSDARPTKPSPQANGEDRRGLSHGPSYIQGNRPTNLQQSDRFLQNGREIRSRPSEEHSSRERLPYTRPHPTSLQQTHPSQEPTVQPADSSESIPQIPGSFPSSEFVRNLHPKNSHSELRTRGSQSSIRQARDSDNSVNLVGHQEPDLRRLAGARSTESFRNRLEQQSSRNFTSGGANGERTQPDRANTPIRSLDPSNQPPLEIFETNTIPTPLRTGAPDNWPSTIIQKRERRTSRTGSRLSSSQQTSNSDVSQERPRGVPSQGLRTDLSRNSSDFSTRSDHREEPSYLEPTEPLDETQTIEETSKSTVNGEDETKDLKNTNDASSKSPTKEDEKNDAGEPLLTASIDPPSEIASEGEFHRPGLGPMIKKKSNKELANTMLKAATAYNTFKPRAGGAAEKLLNSEKRATDEHDGVSGVFTAPSAIRGPSLEAAEAPTYEGNSEPQPPLPSQSIDLPPLQTTILPVEPLKETAAALPANDVAPAEHLPAAPDLLREERRRRQRSDYSSKYAESLGINQSLLEGRTFEFDTLLNELGWNEKITHRNNFEGLQSGLRKEITRLEAGTWLGVLENEDERVAAVDHMMDKVITECEELECLLTLYNAELGVS